MAHVLMDIEPATFSVEQAARFLGVSRSAAYEAVHRGEVPSVRIGKRLVVPRRALEAMLDDPGIALRAAEAMTT